MFLYPFWVRLWHLVNAILILILIITGIRLYVLSRETALIIISDSGAATWHDIASKILIISYIGFLAGNILTNNGKHYRIKKTNFFRDLKMQIRYTVYGMFKHEKQPFPPALERKFNPLQKLSYVVIMYIALPLIILSGIGLMIPEGTAERLFGRQGLFAIDVLHIITGIIIFLFLLIHVYLATFGYRPSTGLRGIITGYVESGEDQES